MGVLRPSPEARSHCQTESAFQVMAGAPPKDTAKKHGVGYRNLNKRVQNERRKLALLQVPVLMVAGKRKRDTDTTPQRTSHQPQRAVSVMKTAPPKDAGNTNRAGQRVYRRTSANVRKCDSALDEKFACWNSAMKQATAMHAEQRQLDAAFEKASGGRKRSRAAGRLSANDIANMVQKTRLEC